MKTLQKIFTRDFNLWLNELIRDSLVNALPTVWGKGLSDQISYFDGNSATWYRYADEQQALKDFMIAKPLDDPIFGIEFQNQFRDAVDRLKAEVQNPQEHLIDHLKIAKDCLIKLYPGYPLPIFYCGPWREDVIKVHGDRALPVLDRLMESRKQSERVFQQHGVYLREKVGPLLEEKGYNSHFVKIMTVAELETFAEQDILPAKSKLETRMNGFLHINGTVDCFQNETEAFKKYDLESIKDSSADRIAGMVASKGGIVTGRVQVIYNYEQAGEFDADILVTPMTSPMFTVALDKAKAVVTDEGGLTCHAAIAAREMKVPCIIGTKNATQLLKTGDIVTVDTENGLVTKQ